jgi:RNA polymerase sigma factor (TIGR02999 family)
MDAASPTELAPLLAAARQGDSSATARLFTLLYPELRRVARARLNDAPGPRGPLLDTTVLMHESYERLQRLARLDVNDRGHFLAYASRVMRSVIIDFARERAADKRGGDATHITLSTGLREQLADPAASPEVLQVHEALAELEAIEPRLAQVVEMRYYGGLSNGDIAGALGVSVRTVERDWERARAFLYAQLRGA